MCVWLCSLESISTALLCLLCPLAGVLVAKSILFSRHAPSVSGGGSVLFVSARCVRCILTEHCWPYDGCIGMRIRGRVYDGGGGGRGRSKKLVTSMLRLSASLINELGCV